MIIMKIAGLVQSRVKHKAWYQDMFVDLLARYGTCSKLICRHLLATCRTIGFGFDFLGIVGFQKCFPSQYLVVSGSLQQNSICKWCTEVLTLGDSMTTVGPQKCDLVGDQA